MSEIRGDNPEADTRRPTSIRKKVVFSLLVFSLSFVLLEAILAVANPDFGWEADAPALREQLAAHAGGPGLWNDSDLVAASFSVYEDDRTLLWRIRPGQAMDVRNFLVPPGIRGSMTFRLETNANGFRGPASAEPGTSTVLCLGDSNTFGWGLDESSAYPQQLDAVLGKNRPDAFSVMNLGQPGYSTEQGLALWLERGAAFRPSYVILAFGFNDGVKSPVSDRASMARRKGATGAARSALMLTRTYRFARFLALRAGGAGSRPTRMKPRVDAQSYRANIESLAALARAVGATPVILSIRNKYPEQAADAALASGAPFIDADAIAAAEFDDLRGGGGDSRWRAEAESRFGPELLAREPRWWVDADVAHYNAHVHARLAQEIATLILARR